MSSGRRAGALLPVVLLLPPAAVTSGGRTVWGCSPSARGRFAPRGVRRVGMSSEITRAVCYLEGASCELRLPHGRLAPHNFAFLPSAAVTPRRRRV